MQRLSLGRCWGCASILLECVVTWLWKSTWVQSSEFGGGDADALLCGMRFRLVTRLMRPWKWTSVLLQGGLESSPNNETVCAQTNVAQLLAWECLMWC